MKNVNLKVRILGLCVFTSNIIKWAHLEDWWRGTNEEEQLFDASMLNVEDTRFVEGKIVQDPQYPPYVIIKQNKEQSTLIENDGI